MATEIMDMCDAVDSSSVAGRWMRIALQEALKSDDQSTKNGAIIIVDGGDVGARGHNHFIPGFGHLPEHHERPFKYSVIEHAERDVVYNAAKQGVKTEGGILVANWVACPDCARAIVLSGIKEVITHERCMERTPERWYDEVALGIKMMRDNGILLYYFEGRCGVPNLNNGEWIEL